MDRASEKATSPKPWPETHPRISLFVLTALALAFIVWAGMVGGVDYFTDWF